MPRRVGRLAACGEGLPSRCEGHTWAAGMAGGWGPIRVSWEGGASCRLCWRACSAILRAAWDGVRSCPSGGCAMPSAALPPLLESLPVLRPAPVPLLTQALARLARELDPTPPPAAVGAAQLPVQRRTPHTEQVRFM